MRIDEAMPVQALDGHVGEVADLVVDPLRRVVTHLVVRREHSFKSKHLVPVGAVERVGGSRVELRWTCEQVHQAEQVESMAELDVAAWDPALREAWDVGRVRVLAMPQLISPSGFDDDLETPVREIYDRVPRGLAEVSVETPVRAADGDVVGHLEGFVVDADFEITHLVLLRGHRWRHREVAVPVGEIASVDSETVDLRLGVRAVGDLPSTPFHRHQER